MASQCFETISNVHVDARQWRFFRWWQLFCGVVTMVMIANLQYGWTLFVTPIHVAQGWSVPEIQTALTVLIIVDSFLMPFEGVIMDRFGFRIVMIVSGILVGLCWIIYSVATTLPLFYFASVLGGFGCAGVYGGSIGNSLKWFPDIRGLAAGLVAAGYGAGSAATVAPIQTMIDQSGYRHTFIVWGLIQGFVIMFFGSFLRPPTLEESEYYMSKIVATTSDMEENESKICCKNSKPLAQKVKEYEPLEVIKTPLFWTKYAAMLFSAIPGLIITGNLSLIAAEYKISKPNLTLALTIDRVLNGVSRPICGVLSDHLGRENILFIAFCIEGFGFIIFENQAHHVHVFVGLSAVLFFTYGEAFSLFPASMSDTYGKKYISTNYGLLYTAKGLASCLIPISDIMHTHYKSWKQVLITCAVLGLLAALIVVTLQKYLKRQLIMKIKMEHKALDQDSIAMESIGVNGVATPTRSAAGSFKLNEGPDSNGDYAAAEAEVLDSPTSDKTESYLIPSDINTTAPHPPPAEY